MIRNHPLIRGDKFASLTAVLAAVLFVVAGCASSPQKPANSGAARFAVSLPHVELLPMEYIQEVAVEVRGGRIVSVNRLLDDWDSDVTWDNPGLVTATCIARHFSAGLSDTKVLAEFLTVEFTEGRAALTARLRTSSCDPTGRPDRDLIIGQTELILQPVPAHADKQ